jgi:hypothetical protein
MIELFIIALLASSLEDLQNELNTQNSYRAELENYVISNNVSLGESGMLQLNDFTDAELEQFVKAHMNGDMVTVTGMISAKVNEKLAPALETFEDVINPKPPICKIVDC